MEKKAKHPHLSFVRTGPAPVLRIAEVAATNPEMGPLNYPVNKLVIASAMEELEERLAC